jgi:3-oxoacyl-[acyl-carrier protein] reductase
VRNPVNNSKYDLTDKVAIVTGAARGMGKAVSKILARNGALVFVTDIDSNKIKKTAEEIRSSGGKAETALVNVTNYQIIKKFVKRIIKKHGTIDILVNNAGVLKRRESIEDISGDEWDLVMSVNVKGVFNFSKAVFPHMKLQRSGKIVNISSTAGRSTSELGGAHYTASKAAVLGLSRHLAREGAPYNINVNAVCPGLIDTPMVKETTKPLELKKFIKSIPMGRLGKPEEEADLVLFLVSNASSYINGATIDITGASLLL